MTKNEALELIKKQLEVSIAYRKLLVKQRIEWGVDLDEIRMFQKHVEFLENLDVSDPYTVRQQLLDAKMEARLEADRHRGPDDLWDRVEKWPERERQAHREAMSMFIVTQSELVQIEMFVDAIDK